MKKVGETVNPGEPVIELETDKVNLEVTSEHQGVLKEILKQEGDTVKVGEVIGLLGEEEGHREAEQQNQKQESRQTLQQEQAVPEEGRQVEDSSKTMPSASPAVRKLAREKGLDLSSLQTHGAVGRLSTADIERLENHNLQASHSLAGRPHWILTVLILHSRKIQSLLNASGCRAGGKQLQLGW